ncbi:MAG: hypothetical protein JNL94_16780 [Planctomycetes bacterium]|nr:hypothetical protein [Planctomycetota bacterium]
MSGPVSGIPGFAVGLWRDKGRALTALVSAFVLWFLLGGQVERTEKVFMVVRVLAQSDTTTVADGLTVRIPDRYAVEDFEPKSIDLELKGTNEDLSRVDGGLSGVYMAPDDLLGTESRREVTLDVARDVKFARLKALPNISIEGRPFVQLRVTKRERVDVALTRDNLSFKPASLGAGVKVEFFPSILPVSGPEADIARIREDPRRLKIGPEIDERLLQSFTADAQTLPSNSVGVIDAAGDLHRPPLLRVNDGDPVRVQLKRERAFREVSFKDVRVFGFIPPGLAREGVDPERAVSLTPESVDLSLRVPDEWFKSGDNAALRKGLFVFVNVADMQQNMAGQKLRVRLDGLPKGAEYTIDPPEIDVVWNIPGGGG